MAGEVRGEEQNRIGDLLWTGDFPQRNAEFKLLAKAAIMQYCRCVWKMMS